MKCREASRQHNNINKITTFRGGGGGSLVPNSHPPQTPNPCSRHAHSGGQKTATSKPSTIKIGHRAPPPPRQTTSQKPRGGISPPGADRTLAPPPHPPSTHTCCLPPSCLHAATNPIRHVPPPCLHCSTSPRRVARPAPPHVQHHGGSKQCRQQASILFVDDSTTRVLRARRARSVAGRRTR